jgi:aminomethyltransferase
MNRSPLHDAHAAAGARFTGFAGWEMPLSYEGTLSEHMAVRQSVGVFDVSHLGRFRLKGPRARDLVSRLLCNDIGRIGPRRAQYTMLLTPEGGVVDDIIVWWLDDDEFIVLPNGVNHETVMAIFGEAGGAVEDLRPATALLAVQGPSAPDLVADLFDAHPKRFRLQEKDGLVAAGTGYTGEAGAELMVPAERAHRVWDALLAAGAVPCGLGARDTLRLEQGYPLWGQDLDTTTTPIEAGLEWVVGWDHEFVGREALESLREPDRVLVGFALDSRRVPRPGYALRCGDSTGTVTSGNFSPVLEKGIGMGYMAPAPTAEPVSVEIRDEWAQGRRIDPPFI